MARKIDPQLTGMAGEFLVPGKLFKLELQASVTFGNAKAVDIFAHNPKTNRTFNVQGKSLKYKNAYFIKPEDIFADYIYVFVILNKFEEPEDFFILEGQTILDDMDKFFGISLQNEGRAKPKTPGINYGPLLEFKDNWTVFLE